MDLIVQRRYWNQQQHPNLWIFKSLNMKKPLENKKLKLPDFYAYHQPVSKDEYEVHELENKCMLGDMMKTDL